MDLKVSTVSGCPGDTVTVTVELDNNPGIASLKFDVTYDQTYLTLNAVTFASGFGSYVTAPEPFSSPQTISFVSPLEDVTSNGLFATLTFSISQYAPDGSYSDITVSYDEDDVFDSNYDNVGLNITNGRVTIYEGIPGDIDGDKKVNNKDAILLFRYVAGWNVEVDTGALDVNGDGKANNKDAITLFRYVAGWPNIVLVRGTICNHELTAFEEIAPSCTETGRMAFWQCTKCGKYFSDANGTHEITMSETVIPALGHTPVTDPAVPAGPGTTGLTEGSHCSVCGVILVPQEVIPALESREHNISYDIANGDTYIESLLLAGEIVNNNPPKFSEDSSYTLKNLAVAGYRFLGWYDGAGDNAVQIKKIEAGTTDDVELYAHWEKIIYTVQYKSSLFVDKERDTYTVDTGLVLPYPKLSNYVFTGWSDESGKLYSGTTIPVGATGNIILDANWTSERNKAVTKTVLDPPIITEDEEANVLYFVYEIGAIQNVPLYTIKDFGYINEGGIEKSESTTYKATVTNTVAENISSTVSKATTESSNWTLTNGWNDTTSLDSNWATEHNMTEQEALTVAKSDSNNWNVSTGKNGSTDTSRSTTGTAGWEHQSKINGSTEATVGAKVGASLESSIGVSAGPVNGSIKGTISSELSASETAKQGFETGNSRNQSIATTGTTSSSSGWSNSSSFGGSQQNSQSQTASKTISDKITQQYHYGEQYTSTHTSGESQGLSTTCSGTDQWASAVTYNTSEGIEVTSEWTTKSAKSGYHRWIVAGTAHVFAIVGYDMSSKDFFVYTYSVMDDETHEFEDYSYTTAAYNDQENGVISFEIPFEVSEYVADRTSYSDGLKIDQTTGEVTGYTGTDTAVIIPEYMNVGGGDVVKITGIKAGAFKDNTSIEAVVLSDFITEIPNDCFSGCTNLSGVLGGQITKIGDNAFSGCTSLVDCAVRPTITFVGENAFNGVERVFFNCANEQVVMAAAASGARKICIYLNYLETPDPLIGKAITIPAGTEYFELNGGGRVYNEMLVNSDADETVLNKVNLVSTGAIPFQTSSGTVTLNQSSISAVGIAMVLKADSTALSLQGTVAIQSDNANAVLAKNVVLSEANPLVEGKLDVTSKLLICGEVQNTEYIANGEIVPIDEETFENMLNSYTLYFDAQGGTCSETSRIVANSTKVGTLPVPTKEQFDFQGWFLSDGTEVTADTVFSTGLDVTVYAHWTPKAYTVTWNTSAGMIITVSRTSSPNAGASTGTISSGSTVYYGDVLKVTYSAQTGYTISNHGVTDITVTRNITASDIYTNGAVNAYSVNWNTGTGYTISVNRTSSPNAGANTGSLSRGATVYYGDKLSITYAASTGYSLTGNGVTNITVTGNVTSSSIYASATPNSYTYNIVYKSSNGTALGSTTATYKYGTTNTISAPAKTGYNTPGSQSVAWDSTSAKTITFVYTPKSVSNYDVKTGIFTSWGSSNQHGIRYTIRIEYGTRTANSVQMRIAWTNTVFTPTYLYFGYEQIFAANFNNNAANTGGNVVIAANTTFAGKTYDGASSTGYSNWMTVPVSATTTTATLEYSFYAYDQDGTHGSGTVTVNVPAY